MKYPTKAVTYVTRKVITLDGILKVMHVLTRTRLFSGIPQEELTALLENVPHTLETFRKGGRVMARGDECDELILLLEGTLGGELVGESGKVVEIEKIHAPGEVAIGVLFSSEPRLPVDLMAVEDVKLLKIPREAFLDILMKDRRVLKNFLTIVSDKVTMLASRFYDVSLRELMEKVANYLLELREKYGTTRFSLPMTKEGLSKWFGATRPSVSRVFGILAKRGIIEQDGKIVRIVDEERLLRISHGELK